MGMITDKLRTGYQSERLHYIPIHEDDENVKAYNTEMMNDPSVHALASSLLLRPQGKNEIDLMIKMFNQALMGVAICLLPSEKILGEDATEDKESDQGDKKPKPIIIGSICLGWGGIPPAMTQNRTAALGITLLPRYQNKGYGREAINWALDWAFRHAGLHTVEIGTASFNERAVHLYKDIGFVPTGCRREARWYNRQFYDDLIFSMTESEWEALRGIRSD